MSTTVSGEQKILAITAHIAYLFGGIGFILAPLLIFLLQKDDPFVNHHAKQALVAHLAILALSAITSLLCMLIVGVLLIPIVAILWLVLLVTSLIATVRALNGEPYYYPLIQSLVNKL